MQDLNVREQLELIAQWYGWQDENLSSGLKSLEDAIKLYNHWQSNSDRLPEFADEDWYSETGDDEDFVDLIAVRFDVLGYDPLGEPGN